MCVGFAMRPAGRPMDYTVCSVADQMAWRAAAGPDVKASVDDAVHDDVDYHNGENDIPGDGHDAEEASMIDEYLRMHDITTTSGSNDVIVPEIPRAYDADDAHWLNQPTTTDSGSAVTSQSRLFASGEDVRNRKYYDYVPPADFSDIGVYRPSGVEIRPPPCYPTKREDIIKEEGIHARSTGSGNNSRLNKLSTGSYSSTDAYFPQYGAGAFPVLIDQGQYGGGIATSGVLSDARQQYYLSANGATTGNGSSCAGYLSVDVGGFGPSMLRPLGFQSATAAWPPTFRQ